MGSYLYLFGTDPIFPLTYVSTTYELGGTHDI